MVLHLHVEVVEVHVSEEETSFSWAEDRKQIVPEEVVSSHALVEAAEACSVRSRGEEGEVRACSGQ